MRRLSPSEVLLLVSPVLLVSLLTVTLLLIAARGHVIKHENKIQDRSPEFADLERESPGQFEMITASLTPIVAS